MCELCSGVSKVRNAKQARQVAVQDPAEIARYSARHCPEQHRKHLVNSRRFKYISAAVCSALGRLLTYSWKSFFQSFPKNAQMLASFTGTLERTPQFSRVMFAYTHTPMLRSTSGWRKNTSALGRSPQKDILRPSTLAFLHLHCRGSETSNAVQVQCRGIRTTKQDCP
jgi:hypothetical protein